MRPVRLGGRQGGGGPLREGKSTWDLQALGDEKNVLCGGGSSTESTRSSVEGSARGNGVNVSGAFLTACLQIRSANPRPHHRPPLVLPPRPPRLSTPSPTGITNSYHIVAFDIHAGFDFFFSSPVSMPLNISRFQCFATAAVLAGPSSLPSIGNHAVHELRHPIFIHWDFCVLSFTASLGIGKKIRSGGCCQTALCEFEQRDFAV